MKRLICAAAAAVVASIAIPTALADDGGGPGPPPPDGWSMSISVNAKASLMTHGLVVKLSGTYECAAPVDGSGNDSYGFPIDWNNSGIGGQVTEIVGSKVLTTSFGIPSDGQQPNCDGAVHSWTLQTNQPPMTQDGQLGLFKSGRLIVQAGGGINDTGGYGVGFGNQWVVKATG